MIRRSHWVAFGRDGAALLVLTVLSAMAVQALFGGNDVIRFPWLVAGVAVFLTVTRGYGMLAVAFAAVVIGNLFQGTALETATLNALRGTLSIGIGAWIYRMSPERTPMLRTMVDYVRLFGVGLAMGIVGVSIGLVQYRIGLPILEIKDVLHRVAGNAFGFVISIVPMMVWHQSRRIGSDTRVLRNAAIIIGLSFLFGQVVFMGWFEDTLGQVARGYWMFLFATLAGLFLGPVGTCMVMLLTAVQGLLGALQHTGFFADDIARTQLSNYFFYMLSLSSDGLLVAILFSQAQEGRRRLADARDQAEASSSRLRALLDTATDGIHILDEHGNLVEFSESFARALGYSIEEAGKLNIAAWEAGIPPEKLVGRVRELIRRPAIFETRHRRKDGAIIDVEISAKGVQLSGNDYLYCSARDITERKRAEARERESNLRFEKLFHGSPMAMTLTSVAEGKVLELNRAAEKLYGYTREEVIGKTTMELGAWPDPQERDRIVSLLRDRGQVQGIEIRSRHRSGELLNLSFSAQPVMVGEQQCLLAMMVDISERKRLEEARINSQRMESLGTLAGGIAHDFNNILTAIRGNAALAAEDVAPGSSAAESITEIIKASVRATEVVRRIMAFGRPKESRREAIALGAVAEEVLKLLRPTIPAGIAMQTLFSPEVPLAMADAGQVHEILVNLTTNAAQAIGQRPGRIEYSIEPVQVEGPTAERLSLAPGNYVRVTVKDDGPGMDEQTRHRIFDAFFTTKPVGEGSGLGLSVVYGIMKGHEGAVSVESAPGQGAAFHLYFPATRVVATPAVHPEPPVPTAARPDRLRVLYLDDEEPLVRLGTRALQRLGHEVSGFVDPRQALESFREDSARYDVIITDLAMPGMTGLEFTRAVHQIRPQTWVIMTTGNIDAKTEAVAREAGVQEVVSKPMSFSQLGEALGRVQVG